MSTLGWVIFGASIFAVGVTVFVIFALITGGKADAEIERGQRRKDEEA